jgi:hypothetical protein
MTGVSHLDAYVGHARWKEVRDRLDALEAAVAELRSPREGEASRPGADERRRALEAYAYMASDDSPSLAFLAGWDAHAAASKARGG